MPRFAADLTETILIGSPAFARIKPCAIFLRQQMVGIAVVVMLLSEIERDHQAGVAGLERQKRAVSRTSSKVGGSTSSPFSNETCNQSRSPGWSSSGEIVTNVV